MCEVHSTKFTEYEVRGTNLTASTKPFLVIYVIWHPSFKEGAGIAESLREHFRRSVFENVSGGTGLSVIYRSTPAPGSSVPLPIDLREAESTAIVVLVDSNLTYNGAWVGYIHELVEETEDTGLGTRIFPVSIESGAINKLQLDEQAFLWDGWEGSLEKRQWRLIGELTYEFCRILRHYLEHLKRPAESDATLEAYLKKVQIFLSHSKHDAEGERIAYAVRDRIHSGHALSIFFDVHDIPAGLRFYKVLLQQVRVSAMIAIYTDSYSSREWCRREVIEAKLWNVPLVVANCISNLDDRSFPYMGNVPVVRLDGCEASRIDFIINRLLDEVLKDFLWRCQVELAQSRAGSHVMFMPRPPELISLACLPPEAEVPEPMIVYPGPPLSNEEERLFADIAPRVRLRSLMEWMAENFK